MTVNPADFNVPASGGNSIAGSNDLQDSLNVLNSTINSLIQAIQGAANNNTGTSTSVIQTSGAAGQTVTTGSLNNRAGNLITPAGSSNGANPGGMWGGGVGGGGAGTNGGGALSNFSITNNVVGALSSALTGSANYLFQQGSNQINTQAQINTYGYQQAAFFNTSAASANMTAFGGYTVGGGSSNNGALVVNNMATSASDARFGGAMLSQMAGTPNYTVGQPGVGYGANPYLSAAGVAMANPGLGAEGAASVAQTLYSPTTSWNLRMMGVGITPLTMGTGQSNNMSAVQAAIGQRFGFKGYNAQTGTFNSASLAANLNSPLFQYQMEQAMGMNSQEYQEWAQSWTQANTAVSNYNARNPGKSLTMQQIQSQIGQYMSNTSSAAQAQAKQQLQAEGISPSLLQNLTNMQANSTAASNTQSQSFATGLSEATNAINTLTQTMNNLVNAINGGQIEGFTGGAGVATANGMIGSLGSANATAGAAAGIGGYSAIKGALSTLSGDINNYFGGSGTNGQLTGIPGPGAGTVLGKGPGSITVVAPPTLAVVPGRGGITGAVVAGLAKKYGMNSKQQANIQLAANMINTSYPGWANAGQMEALVRLWIQESSWSETAMNPTSGAYGIAQALGHLYGDKQQESVSESQTGNNYPKQGYDRANPEGGSDAGTQMKWGLSYIHGTYGSPAKAWQNEVTQGFYAMGTESARAGYAVVGERGPELVKLSGGQKIFNAAQTAQAPWVTANRLMGSMLSTGEKQRNTGSVNVHIAPGAINMQQGYPGMFQSYDAQSQADNLVQALETSLQKSELLNNMAMGVTG